MRLRTAVLFTVPLLAAFALASCAAPTVPHGSSNGGGAPSASSAPTDHAPKPPAAGEVADPGTKVGLNTYLTYKFTNTDKGTALISAKLDSIDPATADEIAVLKQNFGAKLDGFDLYLLRSTEKKESGDPVVFNADYTFFNIVDAQSRQIQSVSLIGWDGCDNQSFPKEFDTPGTELKQCYVAAVATGGKAPAGLAYVGGYEDDNPYDAFDGKPLLFMK